MVVALVAVVHLLAYFSVVNSGYAQFLKENLFRLFQLIFLQPGCYSCCPLEHWKQCIYIYTMQFSIFCVLVSTCTSRLFLLGRILMFIMLLVTYIRLLLLGLILGARSSANFCTALQRVGGINGTWLCAVKWIWVFCLILKLSSIFHTMYVQLFASSRWFNSCGNKIAFHRVHLTIGDAVNVIALLQFVVVFHDLKEWFYQLNRMYDFGCSTCISYCIVTICWRSCFHLLLFFNCMSMQLIIIDSVLI